MDPNGTKTPSHATSIVKSSPQPHLDVIPHTVVSEEKYFEEKYSMLQKLGEGSFGIVYEAIHRDSGEHCACKIVHKEKASGSRFQLALREVALLKKVQHEHIIRLREVFEIQQKIFLVMELCEKGELSKFLESRGTLSESETRLVMHRLLSAISYLHRHDLVHRDLKLDNILLSKNPNDDNDELYIKVTDFGLSIKKAGNTADDMMDEFCGTPMYMAPEILENKTYSEKCDVWAMGIIMCILLTGIPPFPDESELREANIKVKLSEEQFKNIGKEAKDCIERMLILDPAPRMTAFELLDHPWIKGRPLDSQGQGQRNVLELMKEYRIESESVESATDGEHLSPQKSPNAMQKGKAGSKTTAKTNAGARGLVRNTRGVSYMTNHSKSHTSATDLNHTSHMTSTLSPSGTQTARSRQPVSGKMSKPSSNSATLHSKAHETNRNSTARLSTTLTQKPVSDAGKKTNVER